MTDALLVDAYEGDGPKNWSLLAEAGAPWCGVILKATQSLYRRTTWFAEQMSRVVGVCPERNGSSWFFGAYHYLDFAVDGLLQADYFLSAIGGGHSVPGMLWPMVDAERGGENPATLTRDNVVHVTSSFAARIYEITGRRPTLYGGELINALGITDHMGCGRLAIARYAPTLPHEVVARIGWDSPFTWQYTGTDKEAPGTTLAGYPLAAPGCGKVDINVLTLGGGLPMLAAALRAS